MVKKQLTDVKVNEFFFGSDQSKEVDDPTKWVVMLLYIFELVTLNLRCYVSPCSGNTNLNVWISLASVQLFVNLLCCGFVVYKLWFNIPLSTFSIFLGIVLANIVQVSNDPSAVQFLRLLLNITGYFILLRFWHSVRAHEKNKSVLKSNEMARFLCLHFLFIVSIISCLVVQTIHCDEFTLYNSLQTHLEVLLVGYLASFVDSFYTSTATESERTEVPNPPANDVECFPLETP